MKTILIVDDHVLFREGLRNIIQHWDEFEVVGEASNGLEALNLARQLLPNIILMDIAMPVMNGIEAAARISRELPSIRIVMLTMSEDEADLFNALKSGAHGYVLKDTPSKRLRYELRKMMEGETPLSGLMATKVLDEFSRSGNPSQSPSEVRKPLSDRERQVLQLMVEGLSNSQIAERLCLSENTIKKHLRNILGKLHLNNRVEAVVYAVREKLVE